MDQPPRIKFWQIGLLIGVAMFTFAAAIQMKCLMQLLGLILLIMMFIMIDQSRKNPPGQKQLPGPKEYMAIFVFVAILVLVVYQMTQEALEQAISSSMSGSSDF